MRFKQFGENTSCAEIVDSLQTDWQGIKDDDSELSPEELDFLMNLSEHSNNAIKASAIEMLCEKGEIDFQILSKWMKDPDRDIRAIALSAVGYSWISAGMLFDSNKQKAVETLISVWKETQEEYCLIILSDLAFRPEWTEICLNAALSLYENEKSEWEDVLKKVFFSIIIPKILESDNLDLIEPLTDLANPKANRLLLSSLEAKNCNSDKIISLLNALSKSNSYEISQKAWSLIHSISK